MPYKDVIARKEYAASWQQKNKKRNKRRLAKLYASNPKKYKKRAASWRVINRERMLSKIRTYRQNNYPKVMLIAARYRAKKQNVPFSLTVEDILIPSCCPVLGIPFVRGNASWAPGSPSLDRLIPKLGYVRGNVRVISWRANNLKKDATAEELERIAAYIRGEI